MLHRKERNNLTIYFVNILIVILFAILCKYSINVFNGHIIEGRKLYGLIVCLSFSCIMAFRDLSVGVDTAPYSRIFGIIANNSSYMDAIQNAPLSAPAYVIFCKTLSYFSNDPQIVVIVSSLIINISLMMLVNKVSVSSPISYLSWIGLTLFYCSMNGSRQCLALVLALHALVALSENIKNIKAWILFGLAILTHSTALVLLFAIVGVMLSNKVADNKMLFIISSVLSILISFGYGIGVRLVLQFVPRYSLYTSGDSKYSIFSSTGGGRIIFLYLVLLGVSLLWMLKTYSNNAGSRGFIEKMLPAVLFGAIFGIVNCKNELINRLLWYYLGIYVLFIPSVISKYKQYEKLFLKVGIIGILLVYSILSLRENQNGVVPYQFFWG